MPIYSAEYACYIEGRSRELARGGKEVFDHETEKM